MPTFFEKGARLKEFFRFSWQEVTGLIVAAIITGFIFSFRDWGTNAIDVATGVRNLLQLTLISLISFIVHLSFKKYYALKEGYHAVYKPWWVGMALALIIAFVTFGYVSLVLVGGVATAFMVRQRLGEFRYGYRYDDNAMIGLWGVYGNLTLALFLAIGLYYNPQSYWYAKGLLINIVMAFCSFIPAPQQDGLMMYFGSPGWYVAGIIFTVLAALLLLTQTRIGLIIAVVAAVIIVIINNLIEPNV